MGDDKALKMEPVWFPDVFAERIGLPRLEALELMRAPGAWKMLHNRYWDYRKGLEDDGLDDSLGKFHDEVDRGWIGLNEGKFRVFISKKDFERYKINDSDWKTKGSEGYEWVVLAGLYAMGRERQATERAIEQKKQDTKDTKLRGKLEVEKAVAKRNGKIVSDLLLYPEFIDRISKKAIKGEGSQLACILEKLRAGTIQADHEYFPEDSVRVYLDEAVCKSNPDADASASARDPDMSEEELKRRFNMMRCRGPSYRPQGTGLPVLPELRKALFAPWKSELEHLSAEDYDEDIEEIRQRWEKAGSGDRDWSPRLIELGITYLPQSRENQIIDELVAFEKKLAKGHAKMRERQGKYPDSYAVRALLHYMIKLAEDKATVYNCFRRECEDSLILGCWD